MRRGFISILILLFTLSCVAQLERDTSFFEAPEWVVDQRTFDESKILEYKKEERFNYVNNPEYEDNFFQRLRKRFLKWLTQDVDGEGAELIMRILYYGIMILGIFLMIRFFIKSQSGRFFDKKVEDFEEINVEDINDKTPIDQINQMLLNAIEANNYRVAVRLLFLRSLKLLDDKSLIRWKDGKTNHDYINELKNKNLKDHFSSCTRTFEYVWYGEFDLEDKTEFDEIFQQFETLQNKIKLNVD